MNKKLVFAVLIAVVALAAGLWSSQAMRSHDEAGQQAAQLDFSFPDAEGKVQSVHQWRGKILVINFWATWCAPCLKEIPEFVKLQAEYQDRGLQFVGIAIEDKQPVLEFLQRVKVNYPILISDDAGIGLAQKLGNVIGAVPFTLVVDQAGRIVHRQPGELSREQLLEIVAPLFAAK